MKYLLRATTLFMLLSAVSTTHANSCKNFSVVGAFEELIRENVKWLHNCSLEIVSGDSREEGERSYSLLIQDDYRCSQPRWKCPSGEFNFSTPTSCAESAHLEPNSHLKWSEGYFIGPKNFRRYIEVKTSFAKKITFFRIGEMDLSTGKKDFEVVCSASLFGDLL